MEVRRQVPDWIDPTRFETLRWRYHAPEHTHQNGKTIVDVSRVNASVLANPMDFRFPHRVLSFCKQTKGDSDSHLRLHHYLGSWEYFNYRRGDSRWARNRERYEVIQKNANAYESHASDDIRPWLIGFIRHIGDKDTAQELLKGQGILLNQSIVPLDIALAQVGG